MLKDQERLYETLKRDQEQAVMKLMRLIESKEEDQKHQLLDVNIQLEHFKHEQQKNLTLLAEKIMKEKEETAEVRNQLIFLQTKFQDLNQQQHPDENSLDVTDTLNDFHKRFYSHEQRQNGILENLNSLIESEKVETEKREQVERRLRLLEQAVDTNRVRLLEQAVDTNRDTAMGSMGKAVRQPAPARGFSEDLALYDGGFGNSDDAQKGDSDSVNDGGKQKKSEDLNVYDGGFGDGQNDVGEVDFTYDGGY
jgi:hypothetical protein